MAGAPKCCSGFMSSVSPNEKKLNPSMCNVRFNVAAFTVALLVTPLLGSTNPPTWRDSGNRTLVFHGVNVVHKGFPYIPITSHFDSNFSFAAEDVTFLRSIGCNAIRLGVIWAGAQPLPPPSEGAPAPFNMSYFDELERVVAIAAAGGVSVLLDVHQDLYSAAFCGEGAPPWAAGASNASGVLPFPEPIGAAFGPDDYDADGLPTDAACSRHPWQNYQLAHSAVVAYQRLYTHAPLRAAYAAFLQEIARRFKGNQAVLGLEIINEPFAGDVYKDPALFLPGVADKVNLAPFYDEVAAAVRVADPSASIFFESVTWDDIVCGFDHVPGGSEFSSRSVLSYHYYRPPNLSPREALQHQMHECARLSCRCFMTEFSLPLHGMPPQVLTLNVMIMIVFLTPCRRGLRTQRLRLSLRQKPPTRTRKVGSGGSTNRSSGSQDGDFHCGMKMAGEYSQTQQCRRPAWLSLTLRAA